MQESPGGAFNQIDLVLDSNLESVDKAEHCATEAGRTIGLDEDSLHDVGIAVRESMVNAVAHGNRYSAKKKVRFTVRHNREVLVIEILDEGKGFDPEAVPDPREDDNVLRHSGRGLLMIRAFMDEFEIRKQDPQGTYVRMAKYSRRPAG